MWQAGRRRRLGPPRKRGAAAAPTGPAGGLLSSLRLTLPRSSAPKCRSAALRSDASVVGSGARQSPAPLPGSTRRTLPMRWGY